MGVPARARIIGYAAIMAALVWPQPLLAAGYTTLTVMPSFFTSQNSSGTRVSVYDLALTANYHSKHWQASITAPLLTVTGPGVLSAGTIYTTPQAYGRRAGLGDIWLEGSLSLSRPGVFRPAVTPYALIKLPSGSRAAGLGTGTTDYEAGAGMMWRWQSFYPSLWLGYRVVHNSPSYRWGGRFLITVGGSYSLGQAGFLTLLFERRDKGHAQPPAETLFLSYTRPISRHLSLILVGLHGFTTSSTDYGAGLGARIRF